MGLGTLVTRSNTVISSDWFNDLVAALKIDLVPRNASGVATAEAGRLGTSDYPWAAAYLTDLIIDGVPFDATQIAGKPHRISSGKAKTSGYPNFLTPAGSGNGLSATLAAATTNLKAFVNSTAVTISSDLLFSALTAAPSSNNTCAVSDATLTGQAATKVLGEYAAGSIAIGTIGSGITALNGTVAAFKKGSEVLLALVDTTNSKLWPMYRGWAGTARETLTNADTLTLLKVSTLLLNSDGTTHVSSTFFPASVGTSPAAGTAGKVYFERSTQKDAYDDGATIQYGYLVVGWAVCDSADCKWVQGRDFDLGWKMDLDATVLVKNTTTVTVRTGSLASVAGADYGFVADADATQGSNMDSGESIAANSTFFVYMKKDGSLAFSTVAPRPFSYMTKGLYHPSEYYRCIGAVETDGSNNFTFAIIGLADDGTKGTDYFVTTGSSSPTVTLPSAMFCKGKRISVYKSDTGSGVLTVSPSGTETISGDTSRLIRSQFNYLKVVSDGLNWIEEDYFSSQSLATTLTNLDNNSVTILCVRRGRIVTLTCNDEPGFGSKTGSSDPVTAASLSTEFQPSVGKNFPALVLDNGHKQIGYMAIGTTISFKANIATSSGLNQWTGSADDGIYEWSVSYRI